MIGVVDIQILRSGSGRGLNAIANDSRDLMDALLTGSATGIVLDTEGLIENQYVQQLRGSFGLAWLTQMASRNKILRVDRAKVPRADAVKLREAGFPTSNEDYRLYVRTAASCDTGVLVAEDPHFYAVAKLLRKTLGVCLVRVKPACDTLGSAEDES